MATLGGGGLAFFLQARADLKHGYYSSWGSIGPSYTIFTLVVPLQAGDSPRIFKRSTCMAVDRGGGHRGKSDPQGRPGAESFLKLRAVVAHW